MSQAIMQDLPVLENVMCSGITANPYDMTPQGGQRGTSYKAMLTLGEKAANVKLSEDAYLAMVPHWDKRPGGLPPVYSFKWELGYNNELRVTSAKFIGYIGQLNNKAA